MLVLSRKQGERVVVGNGITVTVIAVKGGRVKLGFQGPSDVPIHREEVHRRMEGLDERMETCPAAAACV
jgi:carbon storage regulator